MEEIDENNLAYNSPQPNMNIFEDPKITMLPVVFTKKLDKMDSIKTNWEPLSFKKITTMLLEESKPEYNRNNISTSTIINRESYCKLENKLNTYFQGSKSQNNNFKLDLESIIQKALINITTSNLRQNTKIKIENDTESWSSDDDNTLISAKRSTFEIPIEVDSQNQTSTTTMAELDTTVSLNAQKVDTQSFIKIENETASWSSDVDTTLISAKRRKFDIPMDEKNQNEISTKSKAELDKTLGKMLPSQLNKKPKKEKATTTVAEVQSQLEKSKSIAPKTQATMQDEYEYEYENNILVNVKRKSGRPPKDKKIENPKRSKVTYINNAISNKIKDPSQKENLSKLPAEQNETRSPVVLPNTNQNIKKKIRFRPQDVGLMSIYFCNTGLMAKQQKVAKERYDIGIDGNLEKFFVQSQPPTDFRRHLIERTVCCLYRRALVITEICDEYEISPTAVNFLRAAHLCEVGACLCCCKPTRSVPQSNTIQLPSETKRNVESSHVLPNEPHASSSDTSVPGKNTLFATDKVTKYLLASNYKLSFALKGLVSTLLSNFQGITLTTGSTGKLSAVFNTTFTSWSNTDIQLISTILTKMRKELHASKIPPHDFCDCVNKALNADDSYVEASKLLGSKQLLMLKSLSFFTNPKKVLKQEEGKIEYFRGDPKLLQNAVSEPLNLLNKVVTGDTQKTKAKDKEIIVKPRKEIKILPKTRTKGKQRDKSPEDLRECVFVPETITEEPSENVNDKTATIKNPILQQILSDSAFQPKFADKFGVTQVPLQYLVSVPVTEDKSKHVPPNNVPQVNSIAIDFVDLISDDDEETILP